MASNVTSSILNYDDDSSYEWVTVDAVPERRGVVIKHVEYSLNCRKLGSSVRRRYKDFLAFRELLLFRFSYRIIPKLPPKKINIVLDSKLIEERRRCLQRFLNFIVRHPVLASDVLVKHFLTHIERDIYQTMKAQFSTLPDEFFIHPNSLKAQSLIHETFSQDYKKYRENIQHILIAVSKMHDLLESHLRRLEAEDLDFQDIGKILKDLVGSPPNVPSSPSVEAPNNESNGKYILLGLPRWLNDNETSTIENSRIGVAKISQRFGGLAACFAGRIKSEENNVLDRISMIIEVIAGYQELTYRHEKGVTSEHHRAIRQLNSVRKLTASNSQALGDTPQNLEAIEKTVIHHEAEISTIEQRNAFALYCVQEETRLVYLHINLLASAIAEMGALNSLALSEEANIWREIRAYLVSGVKDDRSASVTPARRPLSGTIASRK